MENSPKFQAKRDRQIGVCPRPALLTGPRNAPVMRHALINPDRDIPTPAQAFRILGPVRHTMLGIRKLVAAGGVVLERHSRNFRRETTTSR